MSDNSSTRFKPGQSGNPGGRPKGARHRITAAFLNAIADDFEAHGVEALERCRTERPESYIRAIAALMPREVEIKRPLQEMEDAELISALRTLESFLATREGSGGVDGPAESATTH